MNISACLILLEMSGIYIVLSKCVICDMIKVLIIIIRPIQDRFLSFQTFIKFFILSKRVLKFRNSLFWGSGQNQMPNVLNSFLLTFNILRLFGTSASTKLYGPKGIISLISQFSFRPEMLSKIVNYNMKACSDVVSLAKIVVSPAN